MCGWRLVEPASLRLRQFAKELALNAQARPLPVVDANGRFGLISKLKVGKIRGLLLPQVIR
jgi:hypothetical protein